MSLLHWTTRRSNFYPNLHVFSNRREVNAYRYPFHTLKNWIVNHYLTIPSRKKITIQRDTGFSAGRGPILLSLSQGSMFWRSSSSVDHKIASTLSVCQNRQVVEPDSPVYRAEICESVTWWVKISVYTSKMHSTDPCSPPDPHPPLCPS